MLPRLCPLARRIPRLASGFPVLAGVTLLAAWGGTTHTRSPVSGAHAPKHMTTSWVPAWTASATGSTCRKRMRDQTVRALAQLPIGGQALRLRLDNRDSATPLRLTVRVALAVARGSTTAPGQLARLHGKSQIVVPARRQVWTDPLVMSVRAERIIAVSMYAPGAATPRCQLSPLSPPTWLTNPGGGDVTAARDARRFKSFEFWTLWLDRIQILSPSHGAIVAVGDSITAGYPLSLQRRWVGLLASTEAPRGFSVVNAGISGDRLLHGAVGGTPMSVRAREWTHVPRVKMILLEGGINDLTKHETAGAVIRALTSVAREARRHHVTIIGMTITPFTTQFGLNAESARDTVNRWIRSTPLFDAVVDLDRLLADPSRPDWLEPKFDSGDHIHPNAAGDARIVNAVRQALRAAGDGADGR